MKIDHDLRGTADKAIIALDKDIFTLDKDIIVWDKHTIALDKDRFAWANPSLHSIKTHLYHKLFEYLEGFSLFITKE
jgi:hypothetical protein